MNNSGYSQRGYNASHRGRNYHNQGDRGRTECKKCGYNNHRIHECRYCEYCDRYGHLTSYCYNNKELNKGRRTNCRIRIFDLKGEECRTQVKVP